MLHEEAVSLSVPWEDLAAGDPVEVTTKMGSPITRGRVIKVFNYGAVQIREYDLEHNGGVQSIADRIYDVDLYLFLPIEDEGPIDPDDPADKFETPVLFDADHPVVGGYGVDDGSYEYEMGEDVDEVLTEKKAKSGEEKSVRKDDRAPKAKVTIDALPKDIQKRLKGVADLDDDARDRVISAISDAALKSLKAVGVKDIEIYARIVKIQDALKPVLGGETKADDGAE
jgi:hypothetical protein